MSNENTSKDPQDTTADLPNGRAATNGAASAAGKHTASSKKKKKKKRNGSAAPSVAAEETPAAPSVAAEETHAAAPPEPDQPPAVSAPEVAAVAEPAEPSEPTAEVPSSVERAAGPIEQNPHAEVAEVPPVPEVTEANLRLRMKVWTDPSSSKRYLVPRAFMRDLDPQGHPISDVMYAYATRGDDDRVITLRASEWNALPFFYFQEDGAAPRADDASAGSSAERQA